MPDAGQGKPQQGKPQQGKPQTIVGFHRDEYEDWVADLSCGHTQHVRHRPPWTLRPWVSSEEGRQQHLGATLYCKKCLADDEE